MKLQISPPMTRCFPFPSPPKDDGKPNQLPDISGDLEDRAHRRQRHQGPTQLPDSHWDHLIPCAGTRDACERPGSLFDFRG